MAQYLPTPPNSAVAACVYIRGQLELKTESEPDVPRDKRFFLESRTRRFFTCDTVKVLLDCSCSKCHSHRRLQQITDPTSYVPHILASNSKNRGRDSGYVTLLALLVYIECPALIYTFIRGHCGDAQFKSQTAKFTSEYVRKTFWCRFPPGDVERFAAEFHWEKYKFAIPRMEGDKHEEYSSSTILPFVNEKRLGRMAANGEIISEGHFGDVYSFEILEEYCDFPQFPGVRTFARKELRRNTPHKRFHDERENLLLVKQLQDKHLIKIVKSYRHGEFYNFIFPCAKTSLNLFLRDPFFRPFPDFRGAVLEHPIWEQVLGIARGLHKVLDYEIPDTKLDNTLYGYHFDLKPANILVERSGNFVITDFGQARFKKVDGTSSKVTGMGGNEAYAPPEIDEDLMVNNRKYDIWSLGCILLEVSAFVVNGHSGLWELDKIRSMPDTESRTHNDRFFRRTQASLSNELTPRISKSETYELKPHIHRWVQRLPEYVPDDSSRLFMNKILLVALQMLDVDVDSRLTSREVCLHLSEIISDRQIFDNQSNFDPFFMPERLCEGFDIGTELMTKIQSISYNLEEYWNTAPLHFFQDSALLCVQVLENRKWVRRSLGYWSQLKLIPQYAMRDRGKHWSSDLILSSTANNVSETFQRRHGKFSTPNALILQEILLAQKVHKNIKLNSATVDPKQARSLSKLIHRKSSGGRPSGVPLDIETNANFVQLWTESLRQDVIGPDAAARRQSPRSLRLCPGPVRVVVFYDKLILILRIAKNERMEPRSNSDPSSKSITIIPTDMATDPSFPVSILRSKSGESGCPGLYLSKDEFEGQEMENRVECSSLKLDFVSKEDADSFQRTYKKLKKHWSEQLKEFKGLQNHIGGEIGYFQST